MPDTRIYLGDLIDDQSSIFIEIAIFKITVI